MSSLKFHIWLCKFCISQLYKIINTNLFIIYILWYTFLSAGTPFLCTTLCVREILMCKCKCRLILDYIRVIRTRQSFLLCIRQLSDNNKDNNKYISLKTTKYRYVFVYYFAFGQSKSFSAAIQVSSDCWQNKLSVFRGLHFQVQFWVTTPFSEQ